MSLIKSNATSKIFRGKPSRCRVLHRPALRNRRSPAPREMLRRGVTKTHTLWVSADSEGSLFAIEIAEEERPHRPRATKGCRSRWRGRGGAVNVTNEETRILLKNKPSIIFRYLSGTIIIVHRSGVSVNLFQ